MEYKDSFLARVREQRRPPRATNIVWCDTPETAGWWHNHDGASFLGAFAERRLTGRHRVPATFLTRAVEALARTSKSPLGTAEYLSQLDNPVCPRPARFARLDNPRGIVAARVNVELAGSIDDPGFFDISGIPDSTTPCFVAGSVAAKLPVPPVNPAGEFAPKDGRRCCINNRPVVVWRTRAGYAMIALDDAPEWLSKRTEGPYSMFVLPIVGEDFLGFRVSVTDAPAPPGKAVYTITGVQ